MPLPSSAIALKGRSIGGEMSIQGGRRERGAEDVPSREPAEPAEHRVDSRRIVGIEGDPRDEPPRQIARDVLQREEAPGRVRRDENLPSDGDDDIVAVGRGDVHFAGGTGIGAFFGQVAPLSVLCQRFGVAARVDGAVDARIGGDGRQIDV